MGQTPSGYASSRNEVRAQTNKALLPTTFALGTALLLGLTLTRTAEGTGDTTPPAAPTALSAATSTSGIALGWNSNTESDLAGYNVSRATNSSGPWTALNTTVLTGSSYYDTTAQPGITSYYKVFAVDTSGNVSVPAQITAARLFTAVTWSNVHYPPLQRSEAFGAAVNGKLYVFGGYYGSYSTTTWTPTKRADVYDPATNTWTRIADLPTALSHVGVAVDGTNIYLAGGYPVGASGTGQTFSTTGVWKYNTATNSYSSMPPLLAPRGGGALVRLDRTLHFFGGADRYRHDASTHWTLNIDTGTAWTTAMPISTPRNHLGGAALNGKVYAVAGQSGQDSAAVYRNNVEAYDPKTNLWSAVTSMPQVRSHHNASTFVMGGRILVVGGESAYSGATLANVTAYDPGTNTWTELQRLPAKRTAGVADQINGIIFQTGGGFTATTFKGVPVAQ